MLIAKSVQPLLGLKVIDDHVLELLGDLEDASEDDHQVVVNTG